MVCELVLTDGHCTRICSEDSSLISLALLHSDSHKVVTREPEEGE